ncbi:hypothetical protein BREV_BREV_00880 [Brevundimonas mediterranea]|uniref:Uncharacterized protein n=1 Tax=Brevundimonas mediterranea TaxID=74329 RepID=A0A7Z8Y0Y5_9CAUL|nr:hypothetical protein BREV_BREV_00880 [Brevundimonas mediterranea]
MGLLVVVQNPAARLDVQQGFEGQILPAQTFVVFGDGDQGRRVALRRRRKSAQARLCVRLPALVDGGFDLETPNRDSDGGRRGCIAQYPGGLVAHPHGDHLARRLDLHVRPCAVGDGQAAIDRHRLIRPALLEIEGRQTIGPARIGRLGTDQAPIFGLDFRRSTGGAKHAQQSLAQRGVPGLLNHGHGVVVTPQLQQHVQPRLIHLRPTRLMRQESLRARQLIGRPIGLHDQGEGVEPIFRRRGGLDRAPGGGCSRVRRTLADSPVRQPHGVAIAHGGVVSRTIQGGGVPRSPQKTEHGRRPVRHSRITRAGQLRQGVGPSSRHADDRQATVQQGALLRIVRLRPRAFVPDGRRPGLILDVEQPPAQQHGVRRSAAVEGGGNRVGRRIDIAVAPFQHGFQNGDSAGAIGIGSGRQLIQPAIDAAQVVGEHGLGVQPIRRSKVETGTGQDGVDQGACAGVGPCRRVRDLAGRRRRLRRHGRGDRHAEAEAERQKQGA